MKRQGAQELCCDGYYSCLDDSGSILFATEYTIIAREICFGIKLSGLFEFFICRFNILNSIQRRQYRLVPSVRNIVGEEVAATLRTSEIRLGGSFFVYLSLYSMSGDASGKPTPSYKEILRSKDKAVSEANSLLKGERKIFKPDVSATNSLLKKIN